MLTCGFLARFRLLPRARVQLGEVQRPPSERCPEPIIQSGEVRPIRLLPPSGADEARCPIRRKKRLENRFHDDWGMPAMACVSRGEARGRAGFGATGMDGNDPGQTLEIRRPCSSTFP